MGKRDAGSQHPPGRGAGGARQNLQPKLAALVLPGLMQPKYSGSPVERYKEEVGEAARVRGKKDRSHPVAGGQGE